MHKPLMEIVLLKVMEPHSTFRCVQMPITCVPAWTHIYQICSFPNWQVQAQYQAPYQVFLTINKIWIIHHMVVLDRYTFLSSTRSLHLS